MRLSLWPQSLFGRLIAASIVALLLAQLASLVFIARERERFILQGSVREWSRRIAEVTTMLQGMDETERSAAVARLSERPWRFGHRIRDVVIFRDGMVPAPDLGPLEGAADSPAALRPPLSGVGPRSWHPARDAESPPKEPVPRGQESAAPAVTQAAQPGFSGQEPPPGHPGSALRGDERPPGAAP